MTDPYVGRRRQPDPSYELERPQPPDREYPPAPHPQRAPAQDDYRPQYPPQDHYRSQDHYQDERPIRRQDSRPAWRPGLTAAEKFWYILMCVWFGAGYLSKIPAKKALADFGLAELTGAESFWYILMCLWFGAGYFAKIPAKKAISELDQFRLGQRPHLEASRPARGWT
jgi:hypothetical protein